jgi:hypothetical protein
MDNLCLDAAVLITVSQGTAGEGMAKTARRVVEPVGGRMSVKAGNPVDKYVGSRVRMRRMLLGISQEELGHHAGGGKPVWFAVPGLRGLVREDPDGRRWHVVRRKVIAELLPRGAMDPTPED